MTIKPGLPLSRQVSEDLLSRIGDGEFAPGDKLPGETELMAHYGVGRNTVREAVQGLVALHMVDVRPRRGATVLTASPERALPHRTLSALLSSEVTKDLYEMRLLLETESAALAAARHDDAGMERILVLHEQMRQEIENGFQPWETDLEVHYAIARACGNSVLPIMLQAAADLLARDREAASRNDLTFAREAWNQHDLVIRAIEARDAVVARSHMDQHIRTASTYVERLRSKQEKVNPPRKGRRR